MFAQLFGEHGVRQPINSHAAIIFRNGRAEESLRRRFLEQLCRRFFRSICVFGDLRNFLLGKIAEQIAEHGLFFCEGKVHNDL